MMWDVLAYLLCFLLLAYLFWLGDPVHICRICGQRSRRYRLTGGVRYRCNHCGHCWWGNEDA